MTVKNVAIYTCDDCGRTTTTDVYAQSDLGGGWIPSCECTIESDLPDKWSYYCLAKTYKELGYANTIYEKHRCPECLEKFYDSLERVF